MATSSFRNPGFSTSSINQYWELHTTTLPQPDPDCGDCERYNIKSKLYHDTYHTSKVKATYTVKAHMATGSTSLASASVHILPSITAYNSAWGVGE